MPVTPELTRAGLIEIRPGVFEKATNAATNVRARAVEASRKADLLDNNSRQASVLESDSRLRALGEVSIQKGTGHRFLVRVTAFRARLLDEDNLCEKYHVDLLRYSGAIPGDSPATTKIEVCQQKTEPGAREEVLIEVFQAD